MDVLLYMKRLFLLLHCITSLGLQVEEIEISGFNQSIYTIVAQMSDTTQMVQHLSYNQLYGYETLSQMNEMGDGSPYELGVNGMFYDAYGRPQGIIIKNHEVLKSKSFGTPLFIIRDNKTAELKDVHLQVYLEYDRLHYPVKGINEQAETQGIYVYTHWFGQTTRINTGHRRFDVKDGKIVRETESETALPIEEDAYLGNRFAMAYREVPFEVPFQTGGEVDLYYDNNFDLATVKEGFQTGGWLVKDGVNVARDEEPAIGFTTSLQPRTAIGILEDGRVIIKVIDGRQPGVSAGVTGKQLASLMIESGAVQAAYLDGGSSSTLLEGRRLVNRPSGGEEKIIAHGLFFSRLWGKMVAK